MARFHLQQQTPGAPAVKVPIEGTVVIGREADCRIILQDDLVSRHHAQVSLQGPGRILVKDLGSTNGTTVAGAPVRESVLKPGQAFVVGRSTFTVVEEEEDHVLRARAQALANNPGMANHALRQTSFVMTEGSDENVYEARSSATVVAHEPARDAAAQPLTMEQMEKLSQRLSVLNRIGNSLSSILELDTLLEEVATQIYGLFPRADRCCILMEENGELRPAKAKQRGKATKGDIRLSRTVVALNRNERKSVLSFDTATDQRLQAAMSIVASGIRSVMSVPIVHKDDFYGILYVDTADFGSPFNSDDLDMLTSLAGQVAVFVKNTRLVTQIQRETELRANLGRYLSPSVVSEIARGNLTASLGGEMREGTVLFSDVVGFTKVCRNLSAAEVVSILNKFFQDLVDAVFRFDGTVDKFGGDAMLCVWGAPVPMKDHALPAVSAALEMQNRLYGFNLDLQASGATVKIRMGIGLNSGSFIAGNVGSDRRLEYTVIGDNVNRAQRVEEKATGGMVLVSDDCRKCAPDAAAIRMQPTTIRGAPGSVIVHSIRGVPMPPPPGTPAPSTPVKDRPLLCSIPSRSAKAGEAERIETVVVGLARGTTGPVITVRVPGISGMDAADSLDVEFTLPEIPGLPVVTGNVLQARPLEEGRPWRDVDLLVPSLPGALDEVLRPGSAWESKLAPQDIPRA